MSHNFHDSRVSRRLVGRNEFATPDSVVWLLVLANDFGRETLIPFSFVSLDLCVLAPVFTLIAQLPPSSLAFAADRSLHNDVAARINRFGHWITIVYHRNFNDRLMGAFKNYLAKVVYLQGTPPPATLDRLKQCAVDPIVLVDSENDRLACEAAHHEAFSLSSIDPVALRRAIGSRFSMPCEELRRRGLPEEFIKPAWFIQEYPAGFQNAESDLQPIARTGLALLEANEHLMSAVRRRSLTIPNDPPLDSAARMPLAIDSCYTAFSHSLAEFLLHEDSTTPDSDLHPDLRSAIDSYNRTTLPADYESLVRAARVHLNDYPGAQSFILCAPAIHKESSHRFLRDQFPDRILKYFYGKKNADYLTEFQAEDFKNDADIEGLGALFKMAFLENAYLSSVLSLQAVSSRWPVLRLPQLSNACFGRLKEVSQAHQTHQPGAFNKQLGRFQDTLTAEIPAEALTFVTTNKGPFLKVVSDLPIEWLLLNEAPLMFQRTISRLPTRPGNGLFTHLDDSRETLRLGFQDLRNVLILDCTEEHDRIGSEARVLQTALQRMGYASSLIRPDSAESYRRELEERSPFVLIHWGHGSYDTGLDRGYLHIRNERCELWDWRNLTVPPIVMLGACETSALAQTHNNPANAWLGAGARAVLATFLPVEADLTCTLFTRIMANLLEATRGKQQLHDWATVVSKTLILQRYLDFIHGYEKWRRKKRLAVLPTNLVHEYTYRWNRTREDVASKYHRCPEILRESLAHFDGQLAAEFDQYLTIHDVMPHTMFFTHLGSPETIMLLKDETAKVEVASGIEDYWRQRERE